MEVTSVKMENTDKIDEIAFEKFVKKQMKSLKKQWDFFNPEEPLTANELRMKAEQICESYKWQFRITKVVV